MDEMLKKQNVLDAIYAKMEKTDKPDVVLGLAAAMSTVKQMQAVPVNPAEKQESSYNSVKTELEPCDDCIRREDALMALTGQCADSLIEILPKAIKRINALPPVTPQPKMGRWIIKMRVNRKIMVAGNKTWYLLIMCEKCDFIKTIMEEHKGQYKFCPNCGQPKIQEVNNEQ